MRNLTVHVDGRGEVTELWSEPWNVDGFMSPRHVYQSSSDYGVVKAWHLHAEHIDQFAVTRGKVQVVLFDVREDSPTFQRFASVIIGVLSPRLLSIPVGVLHGTKALSSPEAMVINLQSVPHDPRDEYKFRWDCVLQPVWEPRNG